METNPTITPGDSPKEFDPNSLSEESKAVRDSILEKHEKINEAIQEISPSIYPKGEDLENLLEQEANPGVVILKKETRGRHIKGCVCAKCASKRGTEAEPIMADPAIAAHPKECQCDPCKLARIQVIKDQTHKHDILTRMWEGSVSLVASLIGKIPYEAMVFDKNEATMLKDVQPESKLQRKSWGMYFLTIITISIKKFMIAKVPGLKEKIAELEKSVV